MPVASFKTSLYMSLNRSNWFQTWFAGSLELGEVVEERQDGLCVAIGEVRDSEGRTVYSSCLEVSDTTLDVVRLCAVV